MNQDNMAVAKNLKKIRSHRQLSLDQLADLTGVSKSMLRQIETSKSSPTIATIWKIANGLKISFTALLTEQSPDVAIMAFTENTPLVDSDGGYRIYPMISFDPNHSFEIYLVEIDPKVSYVGEPHEGHVEELLFIQTGRLSVTIDNQHYQAEADHCIRFMADRRHRYENTGDIMTRLIMMLTYLP